MESQERIDDANGIIFIRTKGTLNRELGPLAAEARAKAKSLGYRLLFDFSESPNSFSLADAVTWFSEFYDPRDPTLKHVRTAHLVAGESEEFFRFVETAWLNRGGIVKVFTDEPTAVEWLCSIRS